MREEVFQALEAVAGDGNVLREEPMSRHTTFRIGGPAACFVTPASVEAVCQAVAVCRQLETPWFILGNGSNLLVSDQGYDGVVIQIAKNMNHIEIQGTQMRVQAGAFLSLIARKAMEAGLEGLAFASGIPGTLGGAVVMNAGAYGGEMKQVLKTVTVLTPEGEVKVIPAEELEMGYRTSLVKTKNYIVLEAELVLQNGDKDAIAQRMEELKEQRVTKQPLEFPSAGSTFKRPEGYFAGKLIEDAGLRGFQVGGAQVSEKHCGFVVNAGGATAADVLELIRQVQKRVKEQFQVELEPEVKFLGEFQEG